jgi:hypothetical protein
VLVGGGVRGVVTASTMQLRQKSACTQTCPAQNEEQEVQHVSHGDAEEGQGGVDGGRECGGGV